MTLNVKSSPQAKLFLEVLPSPSDSDLTHYSHAEIFENLFPHNRKGEKTMVLFIKSFNKYDIKSQWWENYLL